MVDVTAVDVYVEVIVDVYVEVIVDVYVAVYVEVMVVEVVAFSANTKTLKSITVEERPKPPRDKSMLYLYADLDLEDLQQKGMLTR